MGGCFSSFDLGLQSNVVLVFFPTYVVFQPPATVLSRKLGPRKFLACIALLWGATEIVGSCLPQQIRQRLILYRVSALSRSGLTCSGFASCLESSNPAFIQVLYICSRLGTLAVRKPLVALSFLLTAVFRRRRQAILRFLCDRRSRLCIWGYLSLWLDADGRSCR